MVNVNRNIVITRIQGSIVPGLGLRNT